MCEVRPGWQEKAEVARPGERPGGRGMCCIVYRITGAKRNGRSKRDTDTDTDKDKDKQKRRRHSLRFQFIPNDNRHVLFNVHYHHQPYDIAHQQNLTQASSSHHTL